METSKNENLKWMIYPSMIALAIGILSIIIPAMILLIPILITIVLIYRGIISSLIAYASYMAVIFLMFSLTYTVLIVLLTLPLIISTTFLIKNKRRMYDSVFINSFVSLLSCLLFIGFIYITKGVDLTTHILNEANEFLASDKILVEYLYIMLNDQSAVTEFLKSGIIPESLAGASFEQMQSFSTSMLRKVLVMMLPVALIVYSLASGFFSFFFSHSFLKKKGVDVTSVVPFKDLSVPITSTIAIVVMIIISYILDRFEIDIFYSVLTVLMSVFILVFSIQGCAFIIFFYKNKRVSLFLCILLIILGALLGVIFWLGFFEIILKLRRRFGNNIDSLNGSI